MVSRKRKRRRLIKISPEFIEVKESRFQPYVLILTSPNHTSSIAMAAVAGGSMRYVLLPNDVTPADLPKVQTLVREHYRENDGQCILFGRIIGWLFVYNPSEGIMLAVNGDEIARKQGRFHPISIQIQDAVLDTAEDTTQ